MSETAHDNTAHSNGASTTSLGSGHAPRGLRPAVTFVMPALNEEKNIADAIRFVRLTTDKLDDYEIIVVNDGSSDRTGEIAESLAAEDPHIRVVHNPRNMGFGGAYKVGVSHARMPYVMMVPGDNNHPPDGIIPILDKIGEADLVVPYITNPGVRGHRRMLISRTYTTLLNTLFGQKLPYYNGLVLHRTELLRTITIETNGYAYQSEAVVKLLRRGAKYVTVGVPLGHRDDSTRAFKLKNIIMVGETIWRLMTTR